ncbi:hypothetical protein A9G13_02395 [Gilliamella sp. wkB178]|uniref:hypothetical protein n=1 Tax=Gilliamella sp. wkB178 TaxID=3120259 RepID=UPI00080DCCB1|nr:hypothetical protein [Gilliamella apicola]OCG08930.1 hypothetical protein A9G13_02395 [Gilliamella apicola]
MAVTADWAVMVLMILAADWGGLIANCAELNLGLNRGLNYHFGEMSQLQCVEIDFGRKAASACVLCLVSSSIRHDEDSVK